MVFYPNRQSFAYNAGRAFTSSMVPYYFRNGPPAGGIKTDNTVNQTVISRRPKYKPRKRISFKQRLLRNVSAKHCNTNDSQTVKAPMTHNTIYTCNLTANVLNSTSDSGRIGDSIHVMALKVNALFTSPASTSSSCQLRLLVGWSPAEFNLPATFGSGLGLTDIFEPGTGTNWTNTAIVSPKAFTVLDDRMITVNNNIASVSEIQELVYSVQIDSEFVYKTLSGIYGKKRNLYLVAIACISGGTPGSTAAGQLNASTDLIFKDVA